MQSSSTLKSSSPSPSLDKLDSILRPWCICEEISERSLNCYNQASVETLVSIYPNKMLKKYRVHLDNLIFNSFVGANWDGEEDNQICEEGIEIQLKHNIMWGNGL